MLSWILSLGGEFLDLDASLFSFTFVVHASSVINSRDDVVAVNTNKIL